MAKRRNDEAGAGDSQAKRRKQGLIHNESANPLGADGLSQCFHSVTVRMHVSIAPMFSESPLEGIQRQHLDPLILQYEKTAGGVVVAYDRVRTMKRRGTEQPLAQIIGESPFSFVWVAADLLIWSPQSGDVVEGGISVQSPSHIALLVHDTFNATIRRNDIPDSWEFVPNEDDEAGEQSLGYWQDAQGQRIDGKLQFTVKRFNHTGRTVLVLGSLLTADDIVPPQVGGDSDSASNKHHTKFENGEASETGKGHKKFTDEDDAASNTVYAASQQKHMKFDDEPASSQKSEEVTAEPVASGSRKDDDDDSSSSDDSSGSESGSESGSGSGSGNEN